MSFSKRSTVVALGLIAALSVEIGCGKGEDGHTGHKLTASAGVSKKVNKDGSVTITGADGKAITKDSNAGKADIDKNQSQLESATKIAKENLPAGSYSLKAMASILLYNKGAETLTALLDQSFTTDAQGKSTGPAPLSKVSGEMKTSADEQRDLVFPSIFTLPAVQGMYLDTKVVVHSMYDITAKSIVNKLDNGSDIKASVVRVIGDSTITADKNGRYQLVNDSGVTLYMTFMSVDAQTVRIMVSFEEKPAATGANANPAAETKYRNFYLDYGVTAPATKATDAPKADAGTVHDAGTTLPADGGIATPVNAPETAAPAAGVDTQSI